MKCNSSAMLLLVLTCSSGLVLAEHALAQAAPTNPFKLGTFRDGSHEFLGVVFQDGRVAEISAANVEFQRRNRRASKIVIPQDMDDLIAHYDDQIGPRLREMASAYAGHGVSFHTYSVASLTILPPMRPAVILNAGANYPGHVQGIIEQASRQAAAVGVAPAAAPPPRPQGQADARPAPKSAPGLWDRSSSDSRPDNPYLFLKSPSVVVGANDNVVVPRGREQIDWECEFAVVIGRSAKNVAVGAAPSYVFGYTIEFDVSDREGRGDRKMGGGPDWFIQKNHDTFAPIGPFIVPKEFLPDPANVRHYFSLNGDIKQDANTGQMEYGIYEMLAYASNVLTLHPGDLISMGTPPGTNIEKENPRWMKPGDVGTCVVEGVGEQNHKIVAQQ